MSLGVLNFPCLDPAMMRSERLPGSGVVPNAGAWARVTMLVLGVPISAVSSTHTTGSGDEADSEEDGEETPALDSSDDAEDEEDEGDGGNDEEGETVVDIEGEGDCGEDAGNVAIWPSSEAMTLSYPL